MKRRRLIPWITILTFCGPCLADDKSPPAMLLAMEGPSITIDGAPFGEAIRILVAKFGEGHKTKKQLVIDDSKVESRPENIVRVSIVSDGNQSLFYLIDQLCDQASIIPLYLPNESIRLLPSRDNNLVFEKRVLRRSRALDDLLGIKASIKDENYYEALMDAYRNGRFPGETMRPTTDPNYDDRTFALTGTVYELQLLEFRMLAHLYERKFERIDKMYKGER